MIVSEFKVVLNEYQNDIRIWSVSELYLKDVLNENQKDMHIEIIAEH